MAFSRPSAHDDDAAPLHAVGADSRGVPGDDENRSDRTPLVDPNALYDLEDQLDSTTAARAFVRDYVAVWNERDQRLSSAVARRNQAASLDAVLSLKIASSMVGATQLLALAGALEAILREGRLEEAEAALPQLHRCGLRTMRELTIQHLAKDH